MNIDFFHANRTKITMIISMWALYNGKDLMELRGVPLNEHDKIRLRFSSK